MNPSSYLTKNVCEQNTTGSNLVLRVCRSAGKGFLALWLLGDVRLPHAPEKISTIDCRMSIRGKEGLRFPYLPFSSTIISICIFWPEEIFRGKVLHCNGAIQKLSAPQEQIGISCSCLSTFSELLSDYSGHFYICDFHSKWNFKI